MKKFTIEIKWAIIFTIAGLLWMFLEKKLGWHDALIAKQPIYTMLFSIIAIIIFVLAIKDKKSNYYENDMDWKQGFLSGSIVSLIVAILSPLSQYIIMEIISPNYFQNAINNATLNNNMSLETAKAFFNLKSYIFQAAFGGLSVGIVTSAIVAYFIKTK
jgi:hypothetical protein